MVSRAKNIKVYPIDKGVREALNSPEVLAYCLKEGEKMASKAESLSVSGKSKYKVTARAGKKRARVRVTTDSWAAYGAEIHKKRLLKLAQKRGA